MKERNLQTHQFIYADIPFFMYKNQYTSFFKCNICGVMVQIEPRLDKISIHTFNCDFPCNEMLIKQIIE